MQVTMNRYSILKSFLFPLFLLVIAFTPTLIVAQEANPIAIRLTDNGQESEKPDTIAAGEEMPIGSAPMKVLFKSQVQVPDGTTWHCEWTFSRDAAFESPFMRRYEDETEFDFTDAGTTYVRLVVTYTNEQGDTDTNEMDPFIIKISESELTIPNAFSPNGDGINDVFKVKYKSLVRFNAYVFNRWGQQLYQWNLANIDDGWDGTYKGRQVKDGVYFIVVEAEGSDGRKYKIKGDINILRGFSGNGSGTTTTPQE